MSKPAIFIWKAGWHAPRGPYPNEAEARSEAEIEAVRYPNEVIHLLTSRTTVQTPALEPIWDDES